MIAATTFNGKTVAVFGLGGSGRAACRALIAGGATVAAWDDGQAARDQAAAARVPVVDLNAADWGGFDSLVLAPGVPLTNPEPHWTAKRAEAAGVEIIGDVEIFLRERHAAAQAMDHPAPAPLIAITGTNGKSTTTALIGHVLKSAGLDVEVGGNIGVAVLDLAPCDPTRFYVLELSSYQIDLTPSLGNPDLAPTFGILLNITPDHIDRHGTFERYAAVKERLVAASSLAIVGVEGDADDGTDPCWPIVRRRQANPGPVALFARGETELPGVIFGQAGYLYRLVNGTGTGLAPLTETLVDLNDAPALRGSHNWENAAAAFIVGEYLGLPHERIAAGLKSFPGLAHRMQPVARRGHVLFVNDSKATNADSADKALAAFERDIYWIAGGRAKEGGIEPLRAHFSKIAKAYLVGESAPDFAKSLAGFVPYEDVGTIDAAVVAAARDAAASERTEPVVLLAPACASFDQFRNFELRGDAFVDAVNRLEGVHMLGGAAP